MANDVWVQRHFCPTNFKIPCAIVVWLSRTSGSCCALSSCLNLISITNDREQFIAKMRSKLLDAQSDSSKMCSTVLRIPCTAPSPNSAFYDFMIPNNLSMTMSLLLFLFPLKCNSLMEKIIQ